MKNRAIAAATVIMLVTLTFLILQGCASVGDAESFVWRQEREPSCVPYSIVYIAPELVSTACNANVRACTIHSQRIIYLPEGAPAWYLDHERRHENGENHS